MFTDDLIFWWVHLKLAANSVLWINICWTSELIEKVKQGPPCIWETFFFLIPGDLMVLLKAIKIVKKKQFKNPVKWAHFSTLVILDFPWAFVFLWVTAQRKLLVSRRPVIYTELYLQPFISVLNHSLKTISSPQPVWSKTNGSQWPMVSQTSACFICLILLLTRVLWVQSCHYPYF